MDDPNRIFPLIPGDISLHRTLSLRPSLSFQCSVRRHLTGEHTLTRSRTGVDYLTTTSLAPPDAITRHQMSTTSFSQSVLGSPFDSSLYLSATIRKQQSLCYNSEGWGPISPIRYDFTPCFLDVWVLAVSVFGIVFGSGALWYLFKKCTPEPVNKNWHFWAKLVSLERSGGNRMSP